MYEFLHQPSHRECVTMSEASPSTLFRRYTDVYYNNYEHIFRELFSDCELLCYTSFMLVVWSLEEKSAVGRKAERFSYTNQWFSVTTVTTS